MNYCDSNLIAKYTEPQLFTALSRERQHQYLYTMQTIEAEIKNLTPHSSLSDFYISRDGLRREIFAYRCSVEFFTSGNYILLYTRQLQEYRLEEARRLQLSTSWSNHTRLTQAKYQFLRAHYPTHIATLAGKGSAKERYYNLLARLGEFRE